MIITVPAVTIQATVGALGRRTAMRGMAEDSAMQTATAAIGERRSRRGRGGPPFAAAGLDEVTPASTTDRKGLPLRGRAATALRAPPQWWAAGRRAIGDGSSRVSRATLTEQALVLSAKEASVGVIATASTAKPMPRNPSLRGASAPQEWSQSRQLSLPLRVLMVPVAPRTPTSRARAKQRRPSPLESRRYSNIPASGRLSKLASWSLGLRKSLRRLLSRLQYWKYHRQAALPVLRNLPRSLASRRLPRTLALRQQHSTGAAGAARSSVAVGEAAALEAAVTAATAP